MNWSKPKVYAVKHKSEAVIAASRSGGIFTALSDEILQEHGVVYGCVLAPELRAEHVRAEDAETRDRMRGSKYLQSKLGDTFQKVQQDLKDGRRVLFTGTSCQVAGLRKFLGKEYENLLCVDIVCHGVPSALVWDNYLAWQEKRHGSRVTHVDFRNKKKFGWGRHIETLQLENGKQVHSEVFATMFAKRNILRPSCYECPYKQIMHPGDLTIADYWGIEKAAPEFDDDKGVSLVLVNNPTGERYFEQIKKMLQWKETRIEDSMQPALQKPFPKPASRETFWQDFSQKEFDVIVKLYGRVKWKQKIRRKIRLVKKKTKQFQRWLKKISGK